MACEKTAKRILLLAESPYFGGITSHILSILDAFQAHAAHPYEFLVAAFPGRRDDTTLLDGCLARGIAVHSLPMAWTYDWRVAGALRRFVHEQGIDLIHTHNYRATLVTALAKHGVPVVNTCHGQVAEPSWRLKAWQAIELRVMRRHRFTIACSEYVRAWLLGKGLPEGQVRTVYNSFSPRQRNEVSPLTRASLGIPDAHTVVLYVGRLVLGKGLMHLLHAMTDFSQMTLVVVGDGPLRNELEAEAEALALDVHWAGRIDNPDPYYELSDAVVLPSAMEAFPMTLIEAAAHAKPGIATKAGGIPEVIGDNETGLLVDYGDEMQLRQALARCADSGLCRSLGQQARKRWESAFTPLRMAEALADVYTDALRG